MKSRYYWKQIEGWKAELRDAIPHEELLALHHRSGPRHLAYAARQLAIIAGCSYALWHLTHPLLWVPFAILQGFTFFNMTTLLHEVVHRSVFDKRRPAWQRLLGLFYATSSGISASQFTRWHLDHHDNLGSWEDDPKRRWLSPRKNARWLKLLYATPALMPIYFRAAAREARSYEAPLRRTIALERTATVAIQLGVATALLLSGGWGVLARVWAVPYFLVFPVAFTLNRLGQHYDIDPAHPLKWATVMAPSRTWDFLFLYSNYHLEHHYFPGVPFYNLPALQRALVPFYASRGIPWRGYSELVHGWLFRNKAPHTNWAAGASPLADSASNPPVTVR